MALGADEQRHHALRHEDDHRECLFFVVLEGLVDVAEEGLRALVLLLHLHVVDLSEGNPYLDVAAIEIGDGEIGVEPDVLNGVSGGQQLEPLLKVAQLAEDVIIDVDLEAEDLALLQLRLKAGVVAPRLALLVTEWGGKYLSGEELNSEGRRERDAGLSGLALR